MSCGKSLGGKLDKMQKTKSTADKTQRMSTVSGSMTTEVSKHYEAVVPKQGLMGQSWIGDPRAAARRKRIQQRQRTWLRVMAGFGLVLAFICSLIAAGAYFMITARRRRTTGEEHNYFSSPFQLKTLTRVCQVKYGECAYESENIRTMCTQPQCTIATWVMSPISNTTKMSFHVKLKNVNLSSADSEGVHCRNGKYCSNGRCVEAYNEIYNKEVGTHEQGTWVPKPLPGNELQWTCMEDSSGRNFAMFDKLTECRRDTCEQSGSDGFQFKIYNRRCILEPDSQTAQRKRACSNYFPHGVEFCKACGLEHPLISGSDLCNNSYPGSKVVDCACMENGKVVGLLPNGINCKTSSGPNIKSLCLFGVCVMNQSSPLSYK